MAKVLFGSYLVRYPLGGMMSYVLQYLIGLKALGHEVILVEKALHPNECFDPAAKRMTDDPSEGIRRVLAMLERFSLTDGYCFVAQDGTYHGMARSAIERHFREADAFVDMGTHGTWLEEATASGCRVLLDGEPGFNQIKMATGIGGPPLAYDHYYTNGFHVGTDKSLAPTAGVEWRHLPHPVSTQTFVNRPVSEQAPFSTVMNWRSHDRIAFNGSEYGQKDIEFEKFVDLPRSVKVPMEIAVAGKDVPRARLEQHGWTVRDAHEVSMSLDRFHEYVSRSGGEFTVCKNVFVALNTGWFSDRSALYLAFGRPVVMQETGFSDYLPTGKGLFAVRTREEAVEAIEEISERRRQNSEAARAIAVEYLDVENVLSTFCREIGL